ncbi:MAG: hypothetical protein RR755_00790 [Erysipelotrichaceae bacterium]
MQEQVKAKIPENPRILVNKSRAIFAIFVVFCVLHLGIGQRDFGSSDLFLWKQAMANGIIHFLKISISFPNQFIIKVHLDTPNI